MALKHRACIRIRETQEPVVTSGTVPLSRRFLRWLIGEPVDLQKKLEKFQKRLKELRQKRLLTSNGK